ncbi:F0F1 ATP synthase subunit B family protein [Marinivivus vitaminiproducens]|uniref:F0F1 ATP synthase subunit B family protein n=1 Tax=Marinivivus vitaminiproducens TaxID=3035935 RepID=UPI0027A5CD82|nr:F0F1 ATP synthase subunit B' [Geminicoccaceae bacterium SCSIO 64248]
MPQFEAPIVTQVVWLIISFGLLYYLLIKKALPRIGEVLEARQDRIAADLDRAADMRREAEQALATYEKLVSDARTKAQTRMAELQARLAEEAQRRSSALDAELHAKIADAEKRIQAARAEALGQIESVAEDISRVATEKLTGATVSANDAKAAVSEAQKVREAA